MLVRNSRLVGIAALVVAVLAVALVIREGGGGGYTIKARFIDAGQLVRGGLVQVGGRSVGSIPEINLTEDGLAEVVLSISDDEFQPLHRGTVASIRQVGLSGIANRFVELSPGPRSAPAIPDGGVLSTAETRPIVDLDALLNALDPKTRARLQSVIRDSAQIYAGAPAPRDANRAFLYFNPALSQARALSHDALTDQASLVRLLQTSATVSTVLAGRRRSLEEGIGHTATTLRALARERMYLQDILERSPGVIRQTVSTLRNVRETLPVVRPALREAQPVATPLARTLRLVPPTVQESVPVVRDTADLLPDVEEALDDLPELEREAVPAIEQLTRGVEDLMPIVIGLRPYTEDLVTGFLIGFGGASSGYYDANGHYGRVAPIFSAEAMNPVLFDLLFPGLSAADFAGMRTGLTARCPGAAAERAPDGSNPWRPDGVRCNPDHDHEG